MKPLLICGITTNGIQMKRAANTEYFRINNSKNQNKINAKVTKLADSITIHVTYICYTFPISYEQNRKSQSGTARVGNSYRGKKFVAILPLRYTGK